MRSHSKFEKARRELSSIPPFQADLLNSFSALSVREVISQAPRFQYLFGHEYCCSLRKTAIAANFTQRLRGGCHADLLRAALHDGAQESALMDPPQPNSLDSSIVDGAPDPSLSISNEDEEADEHEPIVSEGDVRPATLCAFVSASQSLDAPVIDLAQDCVTLKTPKGDQNIEIDHVQPSGELTSRDLLPSVASEVLSGRPATVLCVDAGGDSASWLLGQEASQYADGALAGLVSQFTARAPHGSHIFFSALECFQEKLTDLQSQKPVEFADGPHGRSSVISGLSFREVTDVPSFGTVLAETLAHSRLRIAYKRSHIFFRLEISSDAQRMPPPSPRKPAVPRTPQKANSTTPRSKNSEASGPAALTVALLAPYDPTQREFLSKEQNDIKRSLFNLGLMIDILNKEITSIGFNWRNFRLTRLLRETFTAHHQLLLTVHAVASKEQLPAAQWAFHFASAAKRTRRPRKTPRTLFPATPERPTEVIANLQRKLKSEVDSGNTNVELLKKERAKNLELLKKIQQCEEESKRKDEEIAALTGAYQRLDAESKAQIASIDQLAKERTAQFERKLAEQERMFLQQNAALRRLEQRANGLVQQLKEKNYPIVISEREAKSVEEEAEEAELLIHLQAIIRSQVQSISTFIDQTKNPEAP